METVVGFMGARCKVDGKQPFFFTIEGKELRFNDKPVSLDYTGQVRIERASPADDYHVEIVKGKKNALIHLGFECRINIHRISPRSIEIVVDGGEPFALGVNPKGINVDGRSIDFTTTNEFTYERSSGADPKVISLVVKKRKVRISFAEKLEIGVMPIMHDPELEGIMRDLKPMGKYTNDRIEAYKIQKKGMRALKPLLLGTHPDNAEEWEPVELTEDEMRQYQEEKAAKRQKQFEESCGCA